MADPSGSVTVLQLGAKPAVPPRPEGPRLREVAVVVDHQVSPFEFAIPCEVFGIDRSAQGMPSFRFSVCGVRPGPLRASVGFEITPPHDLAPLRTADLVILPPTGYDYFPPPHLVEALQAVLDRGAIVASLCAASFTLARGGLLTGRRATTHWFHADRFAAEFPDVELVPDVLYVEDGQFWTSAGTAAGVDMCLELVRRAHGGAAANGIARRMVVPPHREGGQAQYVQTPVRTTSAPTLSTLLDWAQEHLAEDLSVPVLADRAGMSGRTLARRFKAETGTTPHQWVLRRRVALAERLLETTDAPVEEVARRSGFASATVLREHFGQLRGTSPTRYRRTFACADEPSVVEELGAVHGDAPARRGDRDADVRGA